MPGGKDLADELSAESHPAQWCEYLEIAPWSDERKKLFREALYRFAVRTEKEGPIGLLDPTCFQGFLDAVRELVQIARQDEKERKAAEPGATDNPDDAQ